MKIQFSDLGLQHKEIKKDIMQSVNKVLKKGDFILGDDVRLFEEEFAKFCNTKYAVGVSSGTAALFLACLSIGVGPQDEVIVPSFTYIATALGVSYTGAKPVFVDIEEDTYNIDINKIKSAITKNTKAIMPVHLYGHPANMPAIMKIAKEYNLKVIEDAAQAHGASIKMEDGSWKVTGGIGDIGCFSFYPSKNLGALGDGGMVVTNDKEIYKKLLMFRDYGRISKYEHAIIGYNSRLDTLQAGILRAKLKKLNSWNNMRIKAASIYNKLLGEIEGVVVPMVLSTVKHVYHVYAIRSKKRDELFNGLKDSGVSAIIHYPIPLHLQKAYEDLGHKTGDFPVSEKIAQEIMSIPMYPHIKEKEIKYVVNVIKKVLS
ncbi:MAG: DegT/DnrJ/EryC1/StrS family aminotransferase [Candidatus Omnitrophica bacterium]|nr:DegT/DnrJ/EryC1/StrS family aminotransferase [Candidatus Omnitrophota bacterium]